MPENADPPSLKLMTAEELADLRRQGRWILGVTYRLECAHWADQMFGNIQEFWEYMQVLPSSKAVFCYQLSNRS